MKLERNGCAAQDVYCLILDVNGRGGDGGAVQTGFVQSLGIKEKRIEKENGQLIEIAKAQRGGCSVGGRGGDAWGGGGDGR